MEDKKVLKDKELEKVTGGDIVSSKDSKDRIACPYCGSTMPFVPINGWWCCANANCGKQIKEDRRSEGVTPDTM